MIVDKLAFEPKYQWVLFSNGTVVLIDNPTDKEKLLETALTQMTEIGPVYRGRPAGKSVLTIYLRSLN